MPDENIADFCTNCGAPNPEKNQFCTGCGASLIDNSPTSVLPQNNTSIPPRSGTTTLLIIAVVAIVVIGGIILLNANLVKNNDNETFQISQLPDATLAIPNEQNNAQTILASIPVTTVTTGLPYTTTTASLSNGVIITYPLDWEKEEVSETSMRDYGRVTTNIANFYSPDITSERALHAQPNIDKTRYSTLSIDVDSNPVTDFERYFNLATIALQEHHGSIDITKHDNLLKISQTDTFSGYKSYQLDFDTDKMRGTYIFTDVEGTIYIFAFKNPSPYSAEVQNMYKSIKIVQRRSDQKSR